ncbi:hypothetical protein N665_0070s0028 [Sinapis alba]|nr:hypothetical protein N665_0070s0028 [Sinapis alba]
MVPRTSLALFVFLNLLFFIYTSAQGTCPRNSLQLRPCITGLRLEEIRVGGSPFARPCCSLIQGLADLDAAVCLCNALNVVNAGSLGINPNLPNVNILFLVCGRTAPKDFQCV